jgi:hypothetical protein
MDCRVKPGNDARDFYFMNQASAPLPSQPPPVLSMHTIAGLI